MQSFYYRILQGESKKTATMQGTLFLHLVSVASLMFLSLSKSVIHWQALVKKGS